MNKGREYRKRLNLQNYLDTHIEEAYNAGLNSRGRIYCPDPPSGGLAEQLVQLMSVTFDGDLISKSDRKELVRLGYAQQYNGWNFITTEGIKYLERLGFIRP